MADKPLAFAAPAGRTGTVSTALYTSLALLFSLLWAMGFLAIKLGLRSSPPLFMTGFRLAIAGPALLLAARLRGIPLPATGREWLELGVLGVLNHGAFLGISALALRHLSAGTGAIVASTNPVMLALAAPLLLRERLGWQRAAGTAVAFLSVIAVMYSRTGRGERPLDMAVLLLANAVMVAGMILFKRWAPRQHLLVVNGVQLLGGALAALIPSLLLEPVAQVTWNGGFFLALAYLIVGNSAVAMLIWFFLLRSGDASRAGAFLFLNPMLGLFLGALLMGEPTRPFDYVGTLGVALGIWLVQRAAASPPASAG